MLYIGSAFFFIFILMLRTDILHDVSSCDNTYKILLVINNRYKILPHGLVQQVFHIGIHTNGCIVGPALECCDGNLLRSFQIQVAAVL